MSEKQTCIACEGRGFLPSGAILQTLCTNCLGSGTVDTEGLSHWDSAIRSLEAAVLETPVDHLSYAQWLDAERALKDLRDISIFLKR